MAATIGIDIGGSSIRALVREESGDVTGRYETEYSPRGITEVVAAAVAAARAVATDDCKAAGVGVPGQVDVTSGEVSLAVNLGIGPEPHGLAGAISAELDMPVEIENDVRTAAIGMDEILRMSGRPVRSIALLSVGTGISAGVVVEGSLLRGAKGMAGEIGHVVVDEAGPRCPCGQRGCLEVLAAGPAIGRAWPGDGSRPATAHLLEAAAGGDPSACEVVDLVIGYLTTALTWMAASYDTELVVLAGGVAATGEPFLNAIRDELARRASVSELAARRLRPEQVILADVLDPPGPRGAALLAANSLQQRVSPATDTASKQQPLGGTV